MNNQLQSILPKSTSRTECEPKVDVLLVDDHPENLIALEVVLQNLGQNLVKVQSGAAALKYLLHHDVAVILLDVQMPGINGFETARLIRQRDRSQHTPIIFLTAYANSDDLRSQVNLSIDFHLRKMLFKITAVSFLMKTIVLYQE